MRSFSSSFFTANTLLTAGAISTSSRANGLMPLKNSVTNLPVSASFSFRKSPSFFYSSPNTAITTPSKDAANALFNSS